MSSKVVIITGASGGLGSALTSKFKAIFILFSRLTWSFQLVH